MRRHLQAILKNWIESPVFSAGLNKHDFNLCVSNHRHKFGSNLDHNGSLDRHQQNWQEAGANLARGRTASPDAAFRSSCATMTSAFPVPGSGCPGRWGAEKWLPARLPAENRDKGVCFGNNECFDGGVWLGCSVCAPADRSRPCCFEEEQCAPRSWCANAFGCGSRLF